MNLVKLNIGRTTPLVYIMSAALAVSLAGCAGAGTSTNLDKTKGAAVLSAASLDSSPAIGPRPVLLGTSGDFVILTKTGVSTTGTTVLTGDVGVSPAARTYATGFSDTLDATGLFSKSIYVVGNIYAANMAVPTPAKMTAAVSDMETAYTDAAGRSNPDFRELLSGDISGQTLAPGLYKWGSGVSMTSDVTLNGGPNDVWIFQVAQTLTVGNGVKVILSGGAQPKNIFWQTAGAVRLGTTSVFKGVILGKTSISLNTGAVLDGRALAQTAVTLIANTVTQPAQ